jgi:hypothetical protein
MSWLDKYSRRDRLRKPGEHWYGVEDLFDPKGIRTVDKGMFILGRLDDVVIVQIPNDTPKGAVNSLHDRLKKAGVQSVCFAVTEDVKFLKLRTLSALEEKAIEDDVQRTRAKHANKDDASNPRS